jgi:hypothetical protein
LGGSNANERAIADVIFFIEESDQLHGGAFALPPPHIPL